jgi:hypothetical protein
VGGRSTCLNAAADVDTVEDGDSCLATAADSDNVRTGEAGLRAEADVDAGAAAGGNIGADRAELATASAVWADATARSADGSAGTAPVATCCVRGAAAAAAGGPICADRAVPVGANGVRADVAAGVTDCSGSAIWRSEVATLLTPVADVRCLLAG